MRVKHFPFDWRNFCNKVLQTRRIIFAILWGAGRWLNQCSGPVRQAGCCLLTLTYVLTVQIFRCCLPVMHVRCADGAYRPSSPRACGHSCATERPFFTGRLRKGDGIEKPPKSVSKNRQSLYRKPAKVCIENPPKSVSKKLTNCCRRLRI